MAARDGSVSAEARDRGVDDLTALVGLLAELLQVQAAADAPYCMDIGGRTFPAQETEQIGASMLRAYRRQYVGSGVAHTRFTKVLGELATPVHAKRVGPRSRRHWPRDAAAR